MREVYVGRNSEIVDGMLKIDHLQFDGNLNFQFHHELTALPDGLIVTGWMDLSGCTSLTSLPDGLRVDDWIDLKGCTALSSLPEDMFVGETIYLRGCTALTELPKGMRIARSLNLEGCTGLKALPEDLFVGYAVMFDDMTIYREDTVVLEGVTLPHASHSLLPGRRLGDVIDHWALSWKGLNDRIIESVEINFEGDLTFDLKPAQLNVKIGNNDMNLDRLHHSLHVSAGESVAASMLRSLGGRLNDAATFFGVPGMDTSHPLMRCEFPLIANSLYPLQDCFNAALMDANAIRAEDWDATDADSFSSISIGRSAVKDAIARERSADEIIDYVIDAIGWQPDDYAGDKDARMAVGLRYSDKLPEDRRIALVDHASPWSILMALAGVPGAELMRFDIPKGPAGSMANGVLEVDRGAAVRFIAEETEMLATAIRPIWGMWGDDADEAQAKAIAAMTPAQVATAWQLLPADRTQIELHSPYFVRIAAEHDDGDSQ